MVDRLQYQNQIFGSQVQQQQTRPQIPTAQPQRQITNQTIQLRHIQPQAPRVIHHVSTQRTIIATRPLRTAGAVQGNQPLYIQGVPAESLQRHQGQSIHFVNGVRGIKSFPIRASAVPSHIISQQRHQILYQAVIKPGQSIQRQQAFHQTQYIRQMTSPIQAIRQVKQDLIKPEVINTVENEYTEAAQIPVPKNEPNEVHEKESNLSSHPDSINSVDTPSDNENINIVISNVVCNYSLPMHIDLRKLALNSWNCSYDRAGTVLTKQKRHPGCHVKISSTGKVYIVGCKSEVESRQAARAVGREVQKIMGKTEQRICIRKFRINNILATCKFPFGILIDQVARHYPKETYYEPELTVGLIWKMTEPKASVRVHTTGTIVITGATSEVDVALAVEKIYGYVKDFRCDPSKISHPAPRKRRTETNDEFNNIKRHKLRDFDDDNDDETGMNQLFFDDELELDEI